jgi:hypothetical protein
MPTWNPLTQTITGSAQTTTRIGIIGDYDASHEPHRARTRTLLPTFQSLSLTGWEPTLAADPPHLRAHHEPRYTQSFRLRRNT